MCGTFWTVFVVVAVVGVAAAMLELTVILVDALDVGTVALAEIALPFIRPCCRL